MAISLGLDQLSATVPTLELAALAHARSDARMFVT
jgi:urease accessory protein UreF